MFDFLPGDNASAGSASATASVLLFAQRLANVAELFGMGIMLTWAFNKCNVDFFEKGPGRG